MELRDATRKLIAETEQMTGFPVAVMEDASLHAMSTVAMAAPNRPGHAIRIHPKAPAGVDYYATYYCRMIQRFFENPPEERFVFGVGEEGRNQIRKVVANSAHRQIGEQGPDARHLRATAPRAYDRFAFHSHRPAGR